MTSYYIKSEINEAAVVSTFYAMYFFMNYHQCIQITFDFYIKLLIGYNIIVNYGLELIVSAINESEKYEYVILSRKYFCFR